MSADTGGAPLLEIDDLRVTYGRGKKAHEAIRGVSLFVHERETLGLVGESGSGKTTLGRVVLGLATASHGQVRYGGRDITDASGSQRRELAKQIQVVFQNPYTSLNPAMRIRDVLVEPLIAQGIKRAEADERVRGLLDRVSMPAGVQMRYARELSGGQRQRIAIARALALNPRLVICDEPVSALDLSTQRRVLDLLIEIQENTGIAILFISHDLAVVRYISHRVAVMCEGEIVEVGDAVQVTDHPRHPYSKRLWAANLVADPDEQARRRRVRAELARQRAAADHDGDETADVPAAIRLTKTRSA